MHFLVAGPSKPRNSLCTGKGSFKAGARGRGKGALCLGILSSLKLEWKTDNSRREVAYCMADNTTELEVGAHAQQCKESMYLSLPDHLRLHYTI